MSIKTVQERLQALGYSPGPADGLMGPSTAGALQAYAWDRLVSEIPVEPAAIDQRAVDLIKLFEGCELKAYRDSVGVWTIGYGTTAAAGLGVAPHDGMVISQDVADGLLMRGLEKFATSIRPKITAPISPTEFGAFLSLAYNIGPTSFGKSSALRKFNAGDKAGAADAMLLWNKAGGKVLKGLVRRREAERALFLAHQ